MKTYLMTFTDEIDPNPRYGRGSSHWVELDDDGVTKLRDIAEELENISFIAGFQLTEGAPPLKAPPVAVFDLAKAVRALEGVAIDALPHAHNLDVGEWYELAETFEPYSDALKKEVAEEFEYDEDFECDEDEEEP